MLAEYFAVPAFAAPDWTLLLTACVASVAVVFTPGPNNIVCAAVGAAHGVRRALPYAWGVTLGFPLMLAAVGFGLGSFLRLYPQSQEFVKIGGVLFLLYLSWRVIFAPVGSGGGGGEERSGAAKNVPGFWQSLMFQWINPKGVSYAFSLIAVYTRPAALLTDVFMLMLITAALSLASTMTWALAGVAIGRFLGTPRRRRAFNIVMGGLLLFAAVGILL